MVEGCRTAEIEGSARLWVSEPCTLPSPQHRDGLIGYLLIQRYSIVLISNQNLKSASLVDWKKKIPLVAAAVRSIRLQPSRFVFTSWQL
jgi:hypothetical protein